MSNVSITDTVYNITVSETNSSVTVSSGDAITVLVDTFTISTNVVNSGSGASVGKEITGDTLYLRSITAGDDIVVAQNTDDITIALADNIDANLTGDTTGSHFGPVTGNVTGNLTGDVVGNIDSNVSSINEITDVAEIRNAGNITINSTIDGFLFASVGDMYVGSLSQAAHITGTEIKSIGTTLEITGNLTGDVTGDLLSTTTTAKNILPDANNTHDLGSSTNLWNQVWTTELRTTAIEAVDDTSSIDLKISLMPDLDNNYALGNNTNRLHTVWSANVRAAEIYGHFNGDLLGDVIGNVSGNLTGDVTGQVSDISNHTTTDLAEGTNLYWTQARFDAAIGDITTDDVAEGSNLYYTDARVNTLLGELDVDIIPLVQSGVDLGNATTYFGRAYSDQLYTVDIIPKTQNRVRVYGNVHPAGNKTYDLGSPTLQWRSAYIGPGSLYIDGQKVLGSDETGDIDITTDAGQNLNISSGADIQFIPQANASGTQAFTVSLDTINLGPELETATVNINGLLEAPDLHIGDLEIEPGLINYTQTGQNLEIRTNSAYLHANVSDLYVGPLSGAVKIDENTISSTVGDLTITGDLVGDVTGTVSDISNHTTTDLTEGTNLYYTDARVDARIPTNISAFTNDSGYITDYTVTEGDVTQHQAALSITESQISDLQHYTDSDARNAISLNSSNVNELSYDSTTGVFSYVSPSTVAATGQVVFEVRNTSGVSIARGDAVYIAGHSGGKILVAKADANGVGTIPAVGLANSAMNNNSDGSVLISGEMTSVDTSSFSVGDVLYVSETPGELTATRPTADTSKVQNIGKVARSDNNNGIIIVSGSGRANDIPNLPTGEVFIGNGGSYETRTLTTDDVSEGSNLYYTDARVDARIPTNVSAFTNDAGYLTSYTETDPIYTASSWYSTTNNSTNWDTAFGWGDHSVVGYLTDLSGQTTSNLTEGSNLYFTDARAISAVEGEATLDLTGDVTISQDLDVTGLITVDDGFSFSTFNPYAAFGGTTMPTTVMGIGQQSGWAGLSIRSRGEHDWGLSGFGIPPEAPRALSVLQAGRLSGSSDDYLNSGDKFAQIMMNPYSGYRTGTEWLTPSAIIEATATENHSSSGMGTKLRIWTTENGDFGGSTDAQHAQSFIEIQGNTIRANDTLKIDDDLIVTGGISNDVGNITINEILEINGSNANETIIGDDLIAGVYNIHGVKVKADDTKWGSIVIQEYEGGANKPFSNGFLNPSFGTEIIGGTPSSPTNVSSGKRLFVLQALAANQTDGTLPTTANFRIKAETTEAQTSTNRGTKLTLETIANGNTSVQESLMIQGDTLIINSGSNDGIIRGGNNLKLGSNLDTNNHFIINSGGDVTVDDNLKVNSTLTVDGTANFNGNVNLGNANTDSIQATGYLKANNGFGLTVLNTATANYLSGVLGIISTGDVAYISDGDSGNPCIGVYNGSSWKRIALGSDISSS